MMWLLLSVSVTVIVGCGAVVAYIMAPYAERLDVVDLAYRKGVNAGQETTGCAMYRPAMTVITGEVGGSVVPLRALHTDS